MIEVRAGRGECDRAELTAGRVACRHLAAQGKVLYVRVYTVAEERGVALEILNVHEETADGVTVAVEYALEPVIGIC